MSQPSLTATILSISRRCSTLSDLDDRSAEAILEYDERGLLSGRPAPESEADLIGDEPGSSGPAPSDALPA